MRTSTSPSPLEQSMRLLNIQVLAGGTGSSPAPTHFNWPMVVPMVAFAVGVIIITLVATSQRSLWSVRMVALLLSGLGAFVLGGYSVVHTAGGLYVKSAPATDSVMNSCGTYLGLEGGDANPDALRDFRICVHGWNSGHGRPVPVTVKVTTTLQDFADHHRELGPAKTLIVTSHTPPQGGASGSAMSDDPNMALYPGDLVEAG